MKDYINEEYTNNMYVVLSSQPIRVFNYGQMFNLYPRNLNRNSALPGETEILHGRPVNAT